MNEDVCIPSPPPVGKSVRFQFGTLLLLGILFINGFAITLGGLALYESYQQHQKRADLTSQNIAKLLAKGLQADFEKIDMSLRAVVDEVDRQMTANGNLDARALDRFMERLRARLPEVDGLRIADAEGIVRYGDSLSVEKQVAISDREYFFRQRDDANGSWVIDEPILSRIGKNWVVPISRRLNRPDGRFAGIVYATISIERINRAFSAIDVGRDGSVALRNDSLALVARSPMLDSMISEIGTTVFFPEAKKRLLAGQTSGTVISPYPADSIMRTVSFLKVPDYPFYVLIGLARDEYLAEWRTEAIRTSLAIIFFCLVTSLSGLWTWRTRRRQLAQQEMLAEQSRRIANDVIALEQAALKNRKLIQAVEQGPAIVVITDAKGIIEYVNPKFTEVSGYAADEAVGQNPKILNAGLTSHALYQELWATILSGSTWHGELLNRRKDGALFWENTWISPLKNEDGGISHFIAVKEDITQRKEAEARMRMLSLALEHSPASVMITKRDGTIEYINPKFTEVTGYSLEDTRGKTPRILRSGLTPSETYEALWSNISSGQEWSGELLNRNRNGDLFWESERIAPITNHQGEITHFVALKEDVTERKQVESALRLSKSAIEASSNGIIMVGAQFAERPVVYVNPALLQLTGYDEGEIIGQDVFHLLETHDEPALSEYLFLALHQGEKRSAVLRSRRKDGTLYWNEFSITVVRDVEGSITHYVGVVNDVSERIEHEEQLAHQATHDVLTGLANRSLLMDRIEQAIANAHRHGNFAAVLLVDLDRFKYINDSLGHLAGDQVIQEVAKRLAGCAREGDTVARMGGDEFVLVLDRIDDENDVVRVLQRIVDRVAEPMLVDGRRLHITSSLGVSLYPKDGDNAEKLLRNADTAMYRAKEQGRNGYWFYTADMNTRMMERLTLEGSLRQALENEEFVIHYQPQLDMRSGQIVGAEALIRWKSPTLGLVPPGKFIPLTEETGLIVPIGDWVLKEVCRQIKRWDAAGLPMVRVAVNISALQFRQKHFAERIKTLLDESRIEADCLELEITESMLMHDVEDAISILKSLKAINLHLSLDDFGTGYSNLSYLKRFPIDVIKLDQSFVRDVLDDPDDATIAKTVIGLSHSLSLKVVAEGVETAEQHAFLLGHQCDMAQGYYFSRPLPADEFSDLLRQRALLDEVDQRRVQGGRCVSLIG